MVVIRMQSVTTRWGRIDVSAGGERVEMDGIVRVRTFDCSEMMQQLELVNITLLGNN